MFCIDVGVCMDTSGKKLKNLLAKLDAPSLDENDLKSLCLAVISDIDGDSAHHARAKIEALRLLKDVVIKKEVADTTSNTDILALLGGTSKKEKKEKTFD